MHETPIDLATLSRGAHGIPTGEAGSRQNVSAQRVPVPASRWKSRILLPAVIIGAFAATLLYSLRDTLLPATRVTVVPVIVKSAAGGGVSGIVAQAAGWVEPDPYPIYVSALTDGIVKEVDALEGQRVKAGQVVARLIDDDAKLELESAQAEYQHHKHDVCDYQAAVTAAQSDWDHPVERQRAVAVADAMLAQTRAEAVGLAAEIEVERAKVAELEETYRREKAASAASALPESQSVLTGLKLETQRAMVKSAEAKLPALQAKIKAEEAESVAAKENQRLRIPETKAIEEAQAKMAAELHTVETVKVKLEQAKLRLDRTEIKSPVDGVVMERLIEQGAKLYVSMNERSSSQAMKLYDPQKLQVRVDVPLADAGKVAIGQKARISVEVLRDVIFEGVVTRVLHQADIAKNTLQVKVAIDKPRAELRPEMLARVQFMAVEQADNKEKEPRERIFARENLIHSAAGQSFVWLWDKGHSTALKKTVVPGTVKQEGWIEISEGLQAGDALIEGDTTNFKDGQRVDVPREENAPAPAMPATPTMPAGHH